MDTIDLLFASNPHPLSALTATSSIPNENKDTEDYDDTINSDDELKIDFSAALLAASNALASVSNYSPVTSSPPSQGNGRFPNATSSRPNSGLDTPVRRCLPRSRADRGKFTILDGIDVAKPEEVLDVDFTAQILQMIFSDPKMGIQFLARFGLIPNTRVCRVQDCPKDQLMSLIKHANGFVWRCRSCRKRREKRIITKISVYEGTFLFYSRMPLNKFFIFMLTWCENPGMTIPEYNRLMGENRLVEETIYNTIGFMRDIIQNWCDSIVGSILPIGGDRKTVEIVETLATEQLSSKTRNRRTRHYTTRTTFICLNDNTIKSVDYQLHNIGDLEKALLECVSPGTTILMKDSYMERFGTSEYLRTLFTGNFEVKTISEFWPEFDEQERDRQFLKTEMNQVGNSNQEPYAYEYFFRRCFQDKCFNNLLRIIRLLYNK